MTLSGIAKLAGTSPSTVSRVISNDPRISEATRTRVQRLLRQHRYQPNVFARALKGGRTGQIGVLSTNIGSGFFAEVLQGIDAATRSRGIHMVCTFAHSVEDYLAMAEDLLTSGRTDGAVMIDPPLQLFAQAYPDTATPAVLCASRPLDRASAWHHLDSVTVNNREAMTVLVEAVAAAGVRRLAHLAGPANTYDGRVRRSAFQSAIRSRRFKSAGIEDGHLIEADGQRTAEKWLRSGAGMPDAVICFNDSSAHGVRRAFESAGFDWKGRVALTGWDNTETAAYAELTSVGMPTHTLGQQAAELLLEQLGADYKRSDTPRHIVLPTSVHFRGSTFIQKRRRYEKA